MMVCSAFGWPTLASSRFIRQREAPSLYARADLATRYPRTRAGLPLRLPSGPPSTLPLHAEHVVPEHVDVVELAERRSAEARRTLLDHSIDADHGERDRIQLDRRLEG